MIKTLMVQGTASHVGKTILASGICRSLLKEGLKVCPFKPQNITSNIIALPNDEVISYAQCLQAKACNILPDARMNPVAISVVGKNVDFIIRGKVIHHGSFSDYYKLLPIMKEAIIDSYLSLSKHYDCIVVEGAGSPVEINRLGDDISNMWFANYFQIPVILVGNMEYGGGFASIAGTFELLEHSSFSLIKGFAFNKYNGNKELLNKGIKYIESRYGKKFLGALPYIEKLNIPEEDTLYQANNLTNANQYSNLDLSYSFERLAHYISKNIDLNFIM
ncbi:AAA family ATPase [Bacteroides salyersiae]|uniref:AAA family ATPase n=1 Tax=Bacteroides salyersiae TaxID=291644 RepID=UPI001C00F149|nr:AAA family ATPase [Bacteroides salyersiae]MBT9871826.1 AAA family ATPase [Bacteroides salyersiae]